MIGCLRTRVRNQPIIALYFESDKELKIYNLEAYSSFDFPWEGVGSGFGTARNPLLPLDPHMHLHIKITYG